ncbi:MAG: fasciclin domain-containing protein [Candidatus Saccharimonadaceae bacterium]
MKKFKFLFLSMLFISVTLVACSDDDNDKLPKNSTIVDVAKSNPNFSSLVKALTITGLDKALENKSASFTVFAPTNQAFADLLTELKLSSLNDVPKATLSNILLYHVLDGSKMAATIKTGYYPTLSPGPAEKTNLSLYVDMSTTMINKRAKITDTDVKADNGVIHVIDKVILPQSIVDIAVTNSSFSILVQALTKAELVATLNGDGPFTVFAPTDDAFKALFKDLKVTGIADLSKETLTPILLSHVVKGNVTSGMLANGEVATLNPDKKLLINTNGGVTIDGNIKVIIADVQGKNGVVHAIDKVIVPAAKSNTIVDVAVSNADFSSLVAALKITGLDATLADKKASYTVFAPTNKAFADLLVELKFGSLNDVPKETLKNILLYHVLSASKMAANITTGYLKTLSAGPSENTNLSIYVDMTTKMINKRAKITATDLKADNGVIHVIDKVILPQTIVDIAVTNPTFSILVQALTKADLVTTLNGKGPFTVFAPTDDAFKALFKELGVSGVADLSKEALTPILLAHVVSGNVTSAMLTNGDVQTLNTKKKVNINITNGVVIDGKVKVVIADVQGKNGVIHVIDKVIIP